MAPDAIAGVLGTVDDAAAADRPEELREFGTACESCEVLATWPGRLAKAKVAGSNPVFRSK